MKFSIKIDTVKGIVERTYFKASEACDAIPKILDYYTSLGELVSLKMMDGNGAIIITLKN